MIATKSGIRAQRKPIAPILDALIYEIIDGQPIHYKGYREVLSGQKNRYRGLWGHRPYSNTAIHHSKPIHVMRQYSEHIDACFVKNSRLPTVVFGAVGQVPTLVQRVVMYIAERRPNYFLFNLFLIIHQHRQRVALPNAMRALRVVHFEMWQDIGMAGFQVFQNHMAGVFIETGVGPGGVPISLPFGSFISDTTCRWFGIITKP